jgi:hypothetical protein
MPQWFRAPVALRTTAATVASLAVLSFTVGVRAEGKGQVVAVIVEGTHADQVAGWIEDRVNAPDTLKEGDAFRSVLLSKGALPLRLATGSEARDVQLLARAQAAGKEAGVDRAILVDVNKAPRGTRVHVWQVDVQTGAALVDSEVTLPRSASAIDETRAALALGPRPSTPTAGPAPSPEPVAVSPTVGVLGSPAEPDRVTKAAPSGGTPNLLSVEAAMGAGTRHFSYVDRITPSLRPYALDAAPLATVSGAVYPLASSPVAVVRDLGVTGDYSRAFALASEDSTGAHVATTWQSFDVGVTERIPLTRALLANLSAGYGGNDFQFTQNLAGGAAALPSVAYRFFRFGGDLRARFLSAFSAYGGGSYLYVLSSGYTADLFPRESVGGVEGHLGATYSLGKSWEVSLSASYTRMFYSFNPLVGDTSVAGGALDEQTRLLAGFSYVM